MEIHLPEIEKATAFYLGVCHVFTPFRYGGAHSFSRIRPIITIQNDSPIRAQEFPESGPFGCLPTIRNPPGEWKLCELGSERMVSAAPIPIQQNGSRALSFL